MSDLVICKGQDGKLTGLGEKGRRAYAKFRDRVDALTIGETMKFSYKLPRSQKHHSYLFAKLTGLFERQERFEDFDRLLDWLKVGAGHVDLFPGPDGTPVAIPKSISWEKMEEQDFIEFHKALNDFLWTDYAQKALWPHLTFEQSYAIVDRWHREYQTT